jgi:WD40 repeat protein
MPNSVYDLAINPDPVQHRLMSAGTFKFKMQSLICVKKGGDKAVTVWDNKTSVAKAFTLAGKKEGDDSSGNSSFDYLCIATDPTGEYMAAGLSDRSIQLWKLKTQELVGTKSIH